jgi:hypothetical protein
VSVPPNMNSVSQPCIETDRPSAAALLVVMLPSVCTWRCAGRAPQSQCPAELSVRAWRCAGRAPQPQCPAELWR